MKINNEKRAFTVLALLGAMSFLNYAQAMNIDEYMMQAREKNPILKSYQTSVEAQELRKKTAEMEYSPVLTSSYYRSGDKSRPNQLGTNSKMEIYTLGVAKKFSTGTSVKIEGQNSSFQNENSSIAAYKDYHTGDLTLTVQQSLWKDFFGEGTRIKVTRTEKQYDLEKMSADLQLRAALIDTESTFLDYAVALEDLKLKKSNLERAKKIDQWTTTRVNNGISDRADLMNAKALVAIREVELLNAEEEVKTQETKFRESLKLSDNEPTPVIDTNINAARPYLQNLMKAKQVAKIEAQMSLLESSLKRDVSFETEDSLRPELNLVAKYATTSYESTKQKAFSEMTSTDYPESSIGLSLTWMFETEAKSAMRQAAQKDYLASQLKSEKKVTEGQNDWIELKRKYDVLKNSVQTLEKVAQFQRERAKAEQDKLSKGRTVTANVVTAETEAGEAEINLLKTRAQIRKLETSGLLYSVVQE